MPDGVASLRDGQQRMAHGATWQSQPYPAHHGALQVCRGYLADRLRMFVMENCFSLLRVSRPFSYRSAWHVSRGGCVA